MAGEHTKIKKNKKSHHTTHKQPQKGRSRMAHARVHYTVLTQHPTHTTTNPQESIDDCVLAPGQH